MNSDEIKGLSDWVDFTSTSVAKAPVSPGVYAFRFKTGCCKRVLGSSDIAYVGMSGRQSLRKRLRQHLVEPDKRHWLRRILSEVGPLEIAWGLCQEPLTRESELLWRYSEDHIELPPGNRQQSMKRQQSLYHRLKDFPFTSVKQIEPFEQMIREKKAKLPSES